MVVIAVPRDIVAVIFERVLAPAQAITCSISLPTPLVMQVQDKRGTSDFNSFALHSLKPNHLSLTPPNIRMISFLSLGPDFCL